MPRPAGEAQEVKGYQVWLPAEIGQSIEGWLGDPFTQPDYRGNLYLVTTDDKGKLRCPAHSQLQAKLDECRVTAGQNRAWVVIVYKGILGDNAARQYDVQLIVEQSKRPAGTGTTAAKRKTGQ